MGSTFRTSRRFCRRSARRRFPERPQVFAGVINLHGEIRPVLDLRRFLDIAVEEGVPARVILLRKDGRELGLQVDSVEEVRWIGAGDLQSHGIVATD